MAGISGSRATAVAGLVGLWALVAFCALVGPGMSSVGGSGRVALFELGEGPKADLRMALALEVSKKRFNKASKKLEALHQAMSEDFVELKKWTIEKEEARAQLEKEIAEKDPAMEIDSENTAEYTTANRSPATAGDDASALHLSSARPARVERAATLPERAAQVRAQKLAAPLKSRRADPVVQKFKGEIGEMIKDQENTQDEVTSLSQQMKAMMNSQALLNKEMSHAFTEMGSEHAAHTAWHMSNMAAAAMAAPVPHKAKRADADGMHFQDFEKSESDSIHKILNRELARLNLNQPVPPQAAMAVRGKAWAHARLHAKAARLQAGGDSSEDSSDDSEASVRREMEAAILAGSRQQGHL